MFTKSVTVHYPKTDVKWLPAGKNGKQDLLEPEYLGKNK